MGNSSSKSAQEASVEIRTSGWRSGSKTESMPIPFSTLNTFEKLAKSSDFKEWISRNLDSDYLVSSLLIDTHNSDSLIDNVAFFRSLSPAAREEIARNIKSFELVTVAGIDVSDATAPVLHIYLD